VDDIHRVSAVHGRPARSWRARPSTLFPLRSAPDRDPTRGGSDDAHAQLATATVSERTVDTQPLPRVETDAPVRAPACPGCGRILPADREICPACGVDVETGETLPSLGEPPEVPSWHTTASVARWWWVAAGVVLIVGVIVAILAIRQVGPFTPSPVVLDAAPDPDELEGDRIVLGLSDLATETIARAADGRVFTPLQMVDDDPATAWRSNGDAVPDGIGEVIDLYLAEPAWVEMILVRNGDHRSDDTYTATARVQRALVTLDGGVTFLVSLLDAGRTAQVVEFPTPILTSTVRIEVVSTFSGGSSRDLALSDIELRGRYATVEDLEEAGDELDDPAAASRGDQSS
jgi:hypothetical protein